MSVFFTQTLVHIVENFYIPGGTEGVESSCQQSSDPWLSNKSLSVPPPFEVRLQRTLSLLIKTFLEIHWNWGIFSILLHKLWRLVFQYWKFFCLCTKDLNFPQFLVSSYANITLCSLFERGKASASALQVEIWFVCLYSWIFSCKTKRKQLRQGCP